MKKLLLVSSIILLPFAGIAGNGVNDSALHTKVTQWMNNANGIRFLENKGQMMDQHHKPVPNVLYEASGSGMDVYVTTSGLSYVFVKFEKHKKNTNSPAQFKQHNDSITETYCRADMQLVGADIRKENIVKEGESEDRADYYYGGICPDGILGVHSYEKVTIKNIYPGIDWVLHSGKKGLKYDFVVHPGADPSQIKLKYKWTDKPQLQPDGSVKISTPMGNITEGAPVSYCNSEQVPTTYVVNDSEIHFNVGDYNSTQTLIIDPTLVWGTYYPTNNVVDLASMNEDGSNVWITGSIGSSYFPTLNPGNGAYFQGTIGGNQSTCILQFSVAGVLKWATYYGGTGLYPNASYSTSIYSDGKNVWVTGYTADNTFPVFNPGGGAYFQGTLRGGQNAFILQFSTTGVRKWATFYGGTKANDIDQAMSIQSDGTNVWVTGYTYSADFPTLNPGGAAYFQGALSGNLNLFIVKFTVAGVRKWTTFYGGLSGDEGYSIYSDGRNVWVTGFAASHDFPTYNPGGGAYYQATLPSTYYSNAFILQFDTAGVRKWATYYGGSGSNYFGDAGYSIQSDSSHVWVCGIASSPDFPTLNSGCGFNQDTVGTVPVNYSTQDVFLLEFSKTGVRKWASYFGTDVENDLSVAWSDGTNLFVSADVSYTSYPLANPGGGAYYFDTSITVFYYPIEILYVGKFHIASSGSLTVSPTVSICRGSSDTLKASGCISYAWSPPTGLSATNIPNPVASPTITTTYTITGIDTGACNGTFIDSVKVIVDTFNAKGIAVTKDTTICSGSSVTLNASGGTSYTWSTGSTTSSTTINNDATTATYTVAVSNGACIKDTGITVTVKPAPAGKVSGNLFICGGNSTTLTASGGTSYKWNTGATTSAITISPSSDTKYSVSIIQNGCADTVSELVTINPPPSITACCDSIITAGQTVQLISSGGGKYLWSPSTGLSCDACPNPIATPTITTLYYVIITSDSGCTAKDSIVITIKPPGKSDSTGVSTPCGEVFIPNIFAPDETTHNNILYVRGNCIASMDFEVFDRWGNKVFESQNINIGWDGTCKSQAMNTGTYIWVLKATMLDGTTIEKKGNVTLIR